MPDRDLKKVLQIRLILDYIAILFFILKGEFRNAQAVWKARSDFKDTRGDYTSSRHENLMKTTHKPFGVLTQSLIFQYYLKGVHKFSQLKQTNNREYEEKID